MTKPKIKGIKSKEYGKGRIDFFLIQITEDLHKHIISLLLKLGFKEEDIKDFDTLYRDEEFFIFGFRKNIRVYVLNGPSNEEIYLIIDSPLRKEDLINKIEEDLQIF